MIMFHGDMPYFRMEEEWAMWQRGVRCLFFKFFGKYNLHGSPRFRKFFRRQKARKAAAG